MRLASITDLDQHPDPHIRHEAPGTLLLAYQATWDGRTHTTYHKVHKGAFMASPTRILRAAQRRAEQAFEEMPHT
jgi:hypothetical protein